MINTTTITKHFKVWRLTALTAIQITFINRYTNLLFFLGKSVRLGISLLFLVLIKNNVSTFAGYSSDQLVVFFLTYQFIDTLAQIFYRGVYNFGNKIRSGEFDFYLGKPLNPLFRSLTGNPDINDLLFIIPTTAISLWLASTLNLAITKISFIVFLALLGNSFLIATALHIMILAFGILTTEVDNLIWLYRDLNRLGQFPINIYLQPLKLALLFLVPIGLMITIPAQVVLNLPPTVSILLTTIIGISFFILSLKIWDWSLRRYSSASS